MSDGGFQGHVALVTGAASGIGLATSQAFAQRGAAVALLDRNADGGRTAIASIKAEGGRCEFFTVDVTSEREIQTCANHVAKRFGGIDYLVNSAGITLVKRIEDCTVEEWDRVLNVNARSVFLCAKHCLPALRRSAHASIVNIASISSFVGQKATPAYVASKGAVLMLSKALALDLAESGIRVNSVCPGITDTPMLRLHAGASGDAEETLRQRCGRVPLGRMLSPKEIADAVLFLCSEQAAGITGTELVVDAGYTAAAEWSRD